MSIPIQCPQELYQIMKCCWQLEVVRQTDLHGSILFIIPGEGKFYSISIDFCVFFWGKLCILGGIMPILGETLPFTGLNKLRFL